MRKYFCLMRVKHYIKNLLIFSAIIFSVNLFHPQLFFTNLLNFFSFSFMCSTIYIFNDICDCKSDKKHPIKKNRPLPSGAIKLHWAILLAFFLFLLSSIFNALPCLFNKQYPLIDTYLFLYGYFILNVLYSLKLKTIPILDVFLLTIGFVIRIVYGAIAIHVAVSHFLYLTVFSFALYISLGKRRNEILRNGNKSRAVLTYYRPTYLKKGMQFFLLCFLLFYVLWALSMNSFWFFISIFIILWIVMLYDVTIEKYVFDDPVDIILNNRMMMSLILFYMIYMGGLLYVF